MSAWKPTIVGENILKDFFLRYETERLRHAYLLSHEVVVFWRLYRTYRANGVPVPEDVMRFIDRLAVDSETGAAVDRADRGWREVKAAQAYLAAVDCGVSPAKARKEAAKQSGLTESSIKTAISRKWKLPRRSWNKKPRDIPRAFGSAVRTDTGIIHRGGRY